jgi:DNA-binding FrmR family transcriptional regulator
MNNQEETRAAVLLRLRRIEGQIRGLQRMVEKEVPCSEVLTQVAAVTAAIKKIGTVMIHTHMEDCMEKMLQKGGPNRPKEIFRDFEKAISRYIDWA